MADFLHTDLIQRDVTLQECRDEPVPDEGSAELFEAPVAKLPAIVSPADHFQNPVVEEKPKDDFKPSFSPKRFARRLWTTDFFALGSAKSLSTSLLSEKTTEKIETVAKVVLNPFETLAQGAVQLVQNAEKKVETAGENFLTGASLLSQRAEHLYDAFVNKLDRLKSIGLVFGAHSDAAPLPVVPQPINDPYQVPVASFGFSGLSYKNDHYFERAWRESFFPSVSSSVAVAESQETPVANQVAQNPEPLSPAPIYSSLSGSSSTSQKSAPVPKVDAQNSVPQVQELQALKVTAPLQPEPKTQAVLPAEEKASSVVMVVQNHPAKAVTATPPVKEDKKNQKAQSLAAKEIQAQTSSEVLLSDAGQPRAAFPSPGQSLSAVMDEEALAVLIESGEEQKICESRLPAQSVSGSAQFVQQDLTASKEASTQEVSVMGHGALSLASELDSKKIHHLSSLDEWMTSDKLILPFLTLDLFAAPLQPASPQQHAYDVVRSRDSERFVFAGALMAQGRSLQLRADRDVLADAADFSDSESSHIVATVVNLGDLGHGHNSADQGPDWDLIRQGRSLSRQNTKVPEAKVSKEKSFVRSRPDHVVIA